MKNRNEKGQFVKGHKAIGKPFQRGHKINLGKKRPLVSIETRKKMTEAQKGKKHWNWQGGITKTYYKRYKQKNRNKVLASNRKRRAIKLNAIGNYTIGEWELLKKQYGYTCPCCKRSEPKIKLTADHIIPLNKGGSNCIENIQPLCRNCNSKKYIKIIKY